jgi:DNA repair exonuclease SbcCD ATPase subunit
MKTIIILSVMAVVLFAGAWVASSFLAKHFEEKGKEGHAEGSAGAETGKEGKEKELSPLSRGNEPAPRPRSGSGGGPDAEQLVQELAKLRERQEAVARQEQQLAARRRALEVIKEDIRSEREEIDKVRKELGEQVKGAEDDISAAERRAQDLEKKRQETEELVKDAKHKVYEADAVRAGGVKRVGGIMDTAEPAEVARIFETMVESGDLMTAAQILANMKDRRAAAVLSAFQDKATAAQLAEKMVGLKQQAAGGRASRTPAPADGGSH